MLVVLDLEGYVTAQAARQEIQKPTVRQIVKFMTQLKPKLDFRD